MSYIQDPYLRDLANRWCDCCMIQKKSGTTQHPTRGEIETCDACHKAITGEEREK